MLDFVIKKEIDYLIHRKLINEKERQDMQENKFIKTSFLFSFLKLFTPPQYLTVLFFFKTSHFSLDLLFGVWVGCILTSTKVKISELKRIQVIGS
ncbi:hypothetical protein RIR_jg708.t1 [Rhizophagus irregularis DAOM 181602=DAOM 197198]|nr:hypothetical protein RIR_jg708.t1 [Rhizophagus irregularis DAOM 181602=DAOM 197198]